ncbi:MAG: metallophosphoesterase family protein [Thermomicrobiales bacterium]|nr:metallophosphoesterase family protein [Thermomicrobiales bacterium]
MGPDEVVIDDWRPPITIGVLSDTHIYAQGRRALPEEVLDLFRRAEVGLILHGGDINDHTVLAALEAIAPVVAVRGNNDVPEIAAILPLRLHLQIGEHRIGVVHGHEGGRTARESAFAAFPETTDLVVYGHSHIPNIEQRGGTVFFNPGSPTDRRMGPHFGVGLLRCSESKIEPNLILFTRPSDLVNVAVP